MFASSLHSRTKRRGIVLVLILGMLGLLALIGVTFATFSNQAQINARNFSQSASFPDPSEMMDFALAQLINDTANPQSVIRGHSLKRDMYGADATNNGALLNGMPNGTPMYVTGASAQTSGANAGMILLTTNIPATTSSPFDFTRWVLTFPAAQDATNAETYVARSHEIIKDLPAGDGTGRQFLIAIPNYDILQGTTTSPGSLLYLPPFDSSASTTVPPSIKPMITGYTSSETSSPATTWSSTLTTVPLIWPNSTTLPTGANYFTLDGRFLHAFNGPGVAGMNAIAHDTALLNNPSAPATAVTPRPLSEYANFRYNGNIFVNVMTSASNATATGTYTPAYGDPNFIPVAMDEDYDACDLENWFLAVQSADGKVVIPSFHRPGIVAASDWMRTAAAASDNGQQLLATRAMSRILRPRQVDGHSPIAFPDLTPDSTGQIHYDVDNDGDGTTDSVWLDLGYAPKRGPEGQLFKPLFAFMVIGLNGRLPLNTAGNLQSRDTSLNPTFDHAEHLGTSPSEIDLRYALQNAWDPNYTLPAAATNQQPGAPYGYFDNAGVAVNVTQNRNILTGTRPYDLASNGDLNSVTVNNQSFPLPNNMADTGDSFTTSAFDMTQVVLRTNPPVAGRWGEKDYVPGLPVPTMSSPGNPLVSGGAVPIFNNAVRAGFSANPPGSKAYDARDDNFNAFDYNGEGADYYDATGSLALPVERIRRYVTPSDVDGNGRVITFNQYTYVAPPGPSTFRQNGADGWGRVSFFRYFRPAGIPFATFGQIPAAATYSNVPAPLSTGGVGALWYDKGPTNTTTNPYLHDVRTNNPYHAFTNALTPDYRGVATNPLSGLTLGGMPTDETAYISTAAGTLGIGTIDTTQTPTATPITPPTYSYYVNSNPNYISPGLNEADEMNLYTSSPLDAPFGAGDLEWLYRYHDVDGVSLNSRLSSLAPVSFLNPRDGIRRRRLFCLDTWEPTNFVWANDNPQGAFSGNSRFNATNVNPAFSGASFQNMYNMGHTLAPADPATDFTTLSNSSSGAPFPVQTPSLAHRDRRINLNFPLPVSNSPVEPVRQKWIRETYQLLKAVLPPRAVDTPEELAQLSQYVVNMIDFRDPDCTTTRFVNTDVWVTEPPVQATGLTTTQATLTYTTAANAPSSTTTPIVTSFDPNYQLPNYTYNAASPATTVGHYLVQHGMEYQPVAINEVLAYQYQTKLMATPPSAPAGDNRNNDARLLFELVNTLTKDAIVGNFPDSSDLDLVGWDLVVLPDDAHGRPDPFTGQIPITQPGLFLPKDASGNPVLQNQPYVSISAAGGSLNLLSAAMPNVYTPAAPAPLFAPTYSGVGGVVAGPPSPTSVLSSLLPTGANAAYTTFPPAASTTKSADNPNYSASGPGTGLVYYYVFGDPILQQTGTPANTEAQGTGTGTFRQPTASTTNVAPLAPPTPPPTPPPTTMYGNVDLTGLLTQRAIPGGAATVPTVPPSATGFTPAGSAGTTLNPGYYYWLYLRRPANPFDPSSEKVVVDSFRFIFQGSRGRGYTSAGDQVSDAGSATAFAPATEYMFSLQRLQPFRGGHAVPPLTQDTTGSSPLPVSPPSTSLLTAYGYSEQTAACQSGSPNVLTTSGQYGSVQSSGPIYHTIGLKNQPADNARDYITFNDRDYASVIEMLTVPSCSPGLFTKQFSELPPPLQPSYPCIWPLAYGMPAATWPAQGPLVTNTTTPTPAPPPTIPPTTYPIFGPPTVAPPANGPYQSPWPKGATNLPTLLSGNGAPHPFPYLNDEFFYTGAGEPTPPANGSTFPSTTAGWVQNELIPNTTGTPPVTVSFRSPSTGNYIGGPGGAGYHKILDFFEVPTPAFKAIGEVASGVNYDWARQDLRPGLLNLNLIFDEEVFFGLMGDSVTQYLNRGQIGMPGSPSYAGARTPSVVTQIDDTGTVTASYHMPSVGYFDGLGFIDPSNGVQYPGVTTTYNSLMKASFADFLSLRHGGSGFVLGNGNGQVGQVINGLASDRPFHSLSYPDINYTILRPAALPPSGNTAPNATTFTLPLTSPPTATTPPAAPQVAATSYAPFTWDPGVKNPYLFVTTTVGTAPNTYTSPSQPPPIPPRRLFQFADAYGSPGTMASGTVPPAAPAHPTVTPAGAGTPNQPSNASVPGDPIVNVQSQLAQSAAPSQPLTLLYAGSGLTSAYPDLSATPYYDTTYGGYHFDTPGASPPTFHGLEDYLGGQFYNGTATPPWPVTGQVDQTDHPYFRTEWLQKVANLTTVRTHQYAVWITVGFFEVTAPGDASLAAANPFLAYDQLGNELGYLDGSNKRYRGFFLIDRTRAVGFNPFQPDDFRNCVAYRQLIE